MNPEVVGHSKEIYNKEIYISFVGDFNITSVTVCHPASISVECLRNHMAYCSIMSNAYSTRPLIARSLYSNNSLQLYR